MQDCSHATVDMADMGVVENGAAMLEGGQLANGIIDQGHGEFLISDFVSLEQEKSRGGGRRVGSASSAWSDGELEHAPTGRSSCRPRDF
jgi:hypothetical protein